MPGKNLSREEAQQRAAILSVDSYRVHLDLTSAVDPTAATFRSTTTIAFRSAEAGAASFADLLAPKVRAVTLNGRSLDPAEVFDGTRVTLAGLAEQNLLVVEADCAYSRTGEGLHRFVDPVDGETYLYTHFEPADSRRVFANFEQPDLKAPFTFTVTAPAAWDVYANAVHTTVTEDGSARVWEFAPTQPISTYLTAVVAGPYHVERDHYSRESADGSTLEIPLAATCRKSLSKYFDADEIFTVTKQGLDFFHDTFDYPYPFGKYDQCFVPEYNIGAMENPGCVTFREEFVFRSKVTEAAYEGRANVILHEMAHMWFGDLVTMRWWDDLWLKESFADFMGSYALIGAGTKYKAAWITFANRRKAWAYRQDQFPTTHPITADIRDLEDAKLNFDGITYAKGASVLKQLVAYVGAEAFFEGSRQYFKRHAFGNTVLGDLLGALEATSGRDLTSWAAAWLQTSGVNSLTPQLTVDAEGRITELAVLQDGDTLRPHRIAIGFYERDTDGALVRTERVELDVDGARTVVPELAGKPRPALVLLNDDDLTYCKIRFDDHSLETLREGLGEIADPLSRALAWSAAWNLTRDGLMPTRDYLDLVDRFAGPESDIGVLQSLHQQAKSALDLYAAPDHRAAGARQLAACALRELRAAEPGSDHQLAWARFLALTADEAEQLQLVEGLLAGTARIDGLAVDQELRWELWLSLASAGRATPEQLRGELELDNTASGRQHLTHGLAALPTPGAKATAWASVVDSDELPNALVEAQIAGFAQPGQRELTAGYTDAYFEVIESVWAQRSIEIAMRIVGGFFPRFQTDQATLAAADAWLAGHQGAAPALRRLVLECRDDLARALRAQAVDQG
ncbi:MULTISPECIES: aminopeptidase N [unclassified Kitasatospora]|uniref:aminopeptidase N n=1 Tax=unclassified Kitasatospora TaxID=2633591 RepID=UPI00070FB8CE|nr:MULTISPECIES: aminopeptidase N [unclassified Kitasatospora]KQV05433.1 aminopeptidase N [Kitasatospora sp. Root107]KRB62239.1 aminopeptidase N [Kitasatospora sp. Root187]